jgi:hypothetical protein
MTLLYNRYTQEALDFPPDSVAAALGTGFWVATLVETTPGPVPEPPPIPPYAGGGVSGDSATTPILDYPLATEPVEDGDWIRILDVSSGQEVRCTRAQFLAALGIAWDNVSDKPDTFPVDWQAVPQAVRSIVSSTGGAGPSDDVPLILWQSPDGLYAVGVRWKTNGSSSLFHRWNGVEYPVLHMPARASIGGGAFQSLEFHLGAEFTPVNGANPATGGMHSVQWGPQIRRWRWLPPDPYDPEAVRVVLAAPTGAAASVRLFQPGGSYFGFYASDVYGPTAIPAWAIQHVLGEVNGLQAVGAVAGASPKIEARGADPNVDVMVKPKGDAAFAVEAAAGAAARITAAGPDTDHILEVTGKGAAGVRMGRVGEKLAFLGGVPVPQPVVAGDKAGDLVAVMASVLAALGPSGLNLIDDQTT